MTLLKVQPRKNDDAPKNYMESITKDHKRSPPIKNTKSKKNKKHVSRLLY